MRLGEALRLGIFTAIAYHIGYHDGLSVGKFVGKAEMMQSQLRTIRTARGL